MPDLETPETFDQFYDAPDIDLTDTRKKLEALAVEMSDATVAVAKAEDALAEAKGALRDVAEKRLPDLMVEVGFKKFTTSNGVDIELVEKKRAHIKEENRDAAMAYLEEAGYGNLIKRQFVIDFGRDDEAWAKRFQRDLARRKKRVNSKVKRTVHSSTLEKFVRESVEDGLELDFDILGVYDQKIAKIKKS